MIISVVTVGLLFVICVFCAESVGTTQPNIIIIVTDDLVSWKRGINIWFDCESYPFSTRDGTM